MYLRADVKVLMVGVCCTIKEFLCFQNNLQKAKQPIERIYFHPFSPPFFTVPMFVHALFRTFGLKHKLYLLSNQTLARESSYRELEWLAYVDASLRREGSPGLRTSRTHSTGQKKIGPYLIDGFDSHTNTVWSFLGCVHHAHYYYEPSCPITKGLLPDDPNPFGVSAKQVAARWEKKVAFLSQHGYKVHYIWECQFELLKKEISVKTFLNRWKKAEGVPPRRLEIRKALRGGRCEAFRLLYKRDYQPGRKLLYLDINSEILTYISLHKNIMFYIFFF
jgi:G:T-mismatch repair DNA endonuclease (very short patch repair protein)